MSGHGDTSHIFQSLYTNLAIAAIKAFAAVYTGSGSMLAEAIHSFGDCANQVLLLIGVNLGRRPPDRRHPLGYGRAVYFWSFMVALLLFTGGGVFSVYEGIHKTLHPEPIENVGVAIGILFVSLVLEGWSTYGNLRAMKQRRGAMPLFQYLRETKDSDLVVVFGENAAATLGLVAALICLGLSVVTGDEHWDGIGSLSVGIILICVAVFLAREVQSLLMGEGADPAIEAVIEQLVQDHPDVDALNSLVTLQQGPGEVLVAMKLRFSSRLNMEGVADTINAIEASLRAARPEVRWCFVEPGKDGEA